MIKYNLNTINDFNYGSDNINKVYYHNAVVYYKILGGGDTPTAQTPCFAVVDNISQYQDREFIDVYDNATSKWYKLNNLNSYEEYGTYGEGRNITYYDGKLTIDNGYEYQYSGGSWVNVGEVSGSTATILSPEYVENTSSLNGIIDMDSDFKSGTKIQIKINQSNNGGGRIIGWANAPDDNHDLRFFFYSNGAYLDILSSRIIGYNSGRTNTIYEYEIGNNYFKNLQTGTQKTGTTVTLTQDFPISLYGSVDYGKTYYTKIYQGDTLERDFIPYTDGNGVYGLFDKVENKIYLPTNGTLTGSTSTSAYTYGTIDYPLYYQDKSMPPDNLIFETMADALSYECPWVGMRATIGGVKYEFNVQYKWEELGITYSVDLNSQWQASTSYGNLTGETNNYDFYESFSNIGVNNGKATMFISIVGYEEFTIKVRNETGGESNYDYVVVNNLDDTTISKANPYVGEGTAENGYVYYKNNGKSSEMIWYDVTFSNIDGGEHVITVTYVKDAISSAGADKGYVAIPKG